MAVCFNYLLPLAPQLATFPIFSYIPIWWHRHVFFPPPFLSLLSFDHFYSSLYGSIFELIATIFYGKAFLCIAA